MVDRRREPRARVEVRVNVSGLDAEGEAFTESVTATNLSRSGALLTRVGTAVRCGDLIAVEYDGRAAHFRIVWVLDTGTPDGEQVAIHKLSNQPCPWEEALPAEPALASSLDDHRG